MTGLKHSPLAQKTSEPKQSPSTEQQATQVSGGTPSSEGRQGMDQDGPKLGRIAQFLGLGAVVLVVSGIVGAHRLGHVITDNAFVNSRAVRLRSPITGNISKFYASPGAAVSTAQVVAQIELDETLLAESQQTVEQTEQQLAIVENNLKGAQDTQQELRSRLASIQQNVDAVWAVESDLSESGLTGQSADVAAAIAKADAAESDYRRFASLLAEGAVSEQVVEQKRADWTVAAAEVRQAQAGLSYASSSLNASDNRTVMQQSEGWGRLYAGEAQDLQENIQVQTDKISQLLTQQKQLKEQLKQSQARYGEQQTQLVRAPFSGVVYRTTREAQEQVDKSESLATLLDCEDLWVEVVLPTDTVKNINIDKPVLVELATESKAIPGEISLMQPISRLQDAEQQADVTRVQALPSTVPVEFSGKSLTRLTVLISPPANYTQSQQFCGVGQPARLTFDKSSWF